MASCWLDDTTEDGIRVEIEFDPYLRRDTSIRVDGRPVLLDQGIHGVRRFRDGGTTVIETDVGTIITPTPLRPQDTLRLVDRKGFLSDPPAATPTQEDSHD